MFTGRRHAAFIGWTNNIKCLRMIFTDIVLGGGLEYILTYKMSQDPLEIFFSSIHACLGFNNNQNVVQFQAAYKKLCAGGILKSSIGNCLWDDDTKILTVKDDQDKDNDE